MSGADPARLVRLSKSCLGPAEKQAVMRVLDHEFLGMGREVQRFENALADFFGRPTACVVNGTAALHLALLACGVGSGDEILVPSLTYVASFQAISATGATPVACDIDPATWLLDLDDAERRITARTRAVMPVHYGGSVSNVDSVYALAARNNLRVIEDSAHAFGTTHRGKRIGAFGDIACFSFDGIKNITSGEGGCVVTNDSAVLRWIQDARLLGIERDTEKRFVGERTWEFDVTGQGWRYHMSDIMAAIGIEQLRRFPELAAARRRIARHYDMGLGREPRIVPLLRDFDNVVPHIYPVRISGLADRASLRARLLERGIQTGVHYQPNHLLTYFRHGAKGPLPVTERLFPELLTLPLHPDLSECDVDHTVQTLIESISACA